MGGSRTGTLQHPPQLPRTAQTGWRAITSQAVDNLAPVDRRSTPLLIDFRYQRGRLKRQTNEKSSEADRPLSALAQSGTNGGNWGVSRQSAPSQDRAIPDVPGFRLERLESASRCSKADCRLSPQLRT